MDFASSVLEETRLRLLTRFGTQVDPWWERLPDVLSELSARWEFVVGEPAV